MSNGLPSSRTRVLFFGTPSFAVPALEALMGAGYVVRCVTALDKPVGRGRRILPPAVKSAARRLGLDVLQPVRLDPAFVTAVAAWKPDVAVLAAYGKIISQALLDVPAQGFLNIHPSLLPRHRGASPVAATILAGDAESGVTLMRLDAGLDTGPIVAQERLALTDAETTGSLTQALARLGASLLLRVLPDYLADRCTLTPQDAARASYAPRLTKEGARIDWSFSAEQIDRMVRAYQPWPVAWTTMAGQRLLLHQTAVTATQHTEPPGTLVDLQTSLGAVCGDGHVLSLTRVQREGKPVVDGVSFRNGSLSSVGRVLDQ